MPKRANGEGNIKHRADGLWEARLFIGDKRKSVYGKTQAEVKRKLHELAAARDIGINLDAQKMTVAEWLDVWMCDYRGGIKDSTKANYAQYIRLNVTPYIGNTKLSRLTGEAIQRVYKQLEARQQSPKSIKNTHGIIHKAFDQAVKLGYIVKNPCDACELPAVQKREMKPITGDNMVRFLEAIKADAYGDLMFVTMFTGLRESEIIGLTWDCIDFAKKWIRVYRQLSLQRIKGGGGLYVFTDLKNKKERSFSAIPAVFDTLTRVRQTQEEWKRKCGEAWSNPHNLVFTNEVGGNLATTTVFWRFKRIVASIGCPEFRFHDLRHSFATLSIEAGGDIKTISESLGHFSTAFTMDVYGHVSEQMQRDNARRMQEHISKLIE